GLFGVPKGKTAEDMKPNLGRAQANAKDLEKKTGFPWGKALLIGGGALLGLNILDRVMSFGMPWFSPMVSMGLTGVGMPGMGGFGGLYPILVPIAGGVGV